MPSNVVITVPAGTPVVLWGNVSTPASLTWTAPDAAIAAVPATCSIVNTGSVASGAWSINAPIGWDVSPSSGSSIAAGATVTVTITPSTSGSADFSLTCSGANITGNPQTIVASTSPYATTATMSLVSSGTTGVDYTLSVTLDAAVPPGGFTATLAATGGAVLGTSSLAFTFGGSTTRTTTIRRTSDGSSTVTMTGSGLTLAGTPVTFTTTSAGVATSAQTRLSNTRLFADVSASTSLSGGSAGGDIVTPARGTVSNASDFVWGVYGPHYYYVDNKAKWAWNNPGGDWIDATGTWQGTASPHFTFTANSVTSGSATYSGIDCTEAAKSARYRGKWNAFIVKCTGGARSIAALHHPSLAAPEMQVTYTDSTTATLACVACVRLESSSAYTQIGAEEAAISASVALEFEVPTKDVSSATISMVISQHTASAATISGYVCNPPTNYVEESFGISRDYGWDSGIAADPNVLFSQHYTTTTLSDYVITGLGSVNVFDSANWNPLVIGLSSTDDDTKLPVALSGTAVAGTNKWIQKQATANVSIVAPSYSSENFAAPPSGNGAMRVLIPGSSAADGSNVGNGGSLGADLWALFSKADCGLVDTFNVRFMYRYHYSGGVPNIADVKMYRSSALGTASYAVPRGKFGPGGHHWTSTGGNNNVGGGNLGWSNRLGNVDAPADLSIAPRSVFAHVQDMLGVNFEIGKDGGMGATLYPDTWYCIEVAVTLNTYNESTGVASADGVMSIYVNGRLDATHTAWKFREGTVPAQSATDLKPFRRMGAIGLCLNDYNGGVMPADRDVVHFYADLVCTDGAHIGQPAAPIPSWVPAAGEVAILSKALGTFTNTFRSTVATYYEPYFSAGIADNYNGTVPNPFYGTYGSIVFEGGGHSYSNDNSVMQLELGYSSCTFRRITTPTPLFGSDSSQATKDANAINDSSSLMDYSQFEYTIDRQPMARHSYGDMNVVAPHQMGGAAFGSFYRLLELSPGRVINTNGAEAAHKVDFTDIGSVYSYRRAGTARTYGTLGAYGAIIGTPMWSVHVPKRNRIYIESHGSGSNYNVRWFDLTLGKFVNGTGTQLDSRAQANGAMLVYVPERDIIIHADRDPATGYLRIRTMSEASDPSWNNTARTLSSNLSIDQGWSEICWCSDSQRLIVGRVTSDSTGVYEIDIPVSLSSTWTVTRAALGSGQSITYRTGDNFGLGYKRWAYMPRIKSIFYMPKAAQDATQEAAGEERAWVYRPRNT